MISARMDASAVRFLCAIPPGRVAVPLVARRTSRHGLDDCLAALIIPVRPSTHPCIAPTPLPGWTVARAFIVAIIIIVPGYWPHWTTCRGILHGGPCPRVVNSFSLRYLHMVFLGETQKLHEMSVISAPYIVTGQTHPLNPSSRWIGSQLPDLR